MRISVWMKQNKDTEHFLALFYAFVVHSVQCPSLYVVRRPSTPRFTIAVKMEEKASDVTRATAAYA